MEYQSPLRKARYKYHSHCFQKVGSQTSERHRGIRRPCHTVLYISMTPAAPALGQLILRVCARTPLTRCTPTHAADIAAVHRPRARVRDLHPCEYIAIALHRPFLVRCETLPMNHQRLLVLLFAAVSIPTSDRGDTMILGMQVC